jgi:hypothetical protein
MFKINNIVIFFIFLTFPFSLNSHVEHYKDLKLIDFDIYRNNKVIGKHTFSFKKTDDKTEVKSEINFKIKKFGVALYKYNVIGTETYIEGNLVEFNSKTNQNGKEKYVSLKLLNDEYVIDGSSYKGKAPVNYKIGTWWNHSIVDSPAQISAVSGRIINQKVTFLGEEVLSINGIKYTTLHFNFSSTDNKLAKKKKLNTDIWYDKEKLNWIKATFEKQGKWEYKLSNLK